MEEKQAIHLTLGNEEEETEVEVGEEIKEMADESTGELKIDESKLTEAERKAVDEFSKKIDITSSELVIQYGAQAQQKIADFSDSALESVKAKDMGEIGNMMADLVGELKNMETGTEEKKGLFGFFKKQGNNITKLKAKYDTVEQNVDKIVKNLENHQIVLLKDVALLDELYLKNLEHYRELTMYILAGQKKLKEVKEKDLAEAKAKADQTKDPEDAQKVADLNNAIVRFEKKLHDLELTRMISLQMAPQIRLVQNNDTMMTEKIQSTLVNTIPLWKSQMLIAIGLSHSDAAMRAQRETADYTNEMLKKNAEKLKMATVDTAKETERGIVDMETLAETNRMLIETLDEVATIQSEGRAKREAARAELEKAEAELAQKLGDIRNR